MALDSHIIKTKTTLKATLALNTLADSNQVLRWFPVHQAFEGNERAD